jgi:FlaA1/EpsC-like NDP-sugar epimerase
MMDWTTSQEKGMAATSPTTDSPELELKQASAAFPMRVAIIGAGRGGTALLDVLHQIGTIEIVGIMDKDPSAPGL